ncbi:M24 family metallopeptidase [Halothermothrix orenii]|uniref:Peptidase M24 n=1 Tax=Halothermothrix orenii (strain H 168 / OCM 544 / DSM 9562) TaxID=373903 RepID=B8CZV8_HALOH|nr:M24 family metallopeptidase [Halothermothrix orenii]ACL70810.1 peptidase M24 [Halothermothrix orenii H 168]
MEETLVKKEKIDKLMKEKGLDGVVLTSHSNITWLTGIDNRIVFASDEGAVKLIIFKDRIEVVTNNIEAGRIREEEGLDQDYYKYIVDDWYRADNYLKVLIDKYNLGSDILIPGVLDVGMEIKRLRFSLLPQEMERYRQLGKEVGKIMSDTCHHIETGKTENEIRAQLASKLWAHNINPLLILVGSDERIYNYRHPIPKDKKIDKYVMVVTCAERDGLIVNLTRFVHFGNLPDELKRKLEAVVRVDASFILNTRVGSKISDIFSKAIAVYENEGYPGEWQYHHQGGATGYETRDYIATPDLEEVVCPNQAFAWNPSIKGVKSEDTILVTEEGFEILTEDPDWPGIEVQYQGQKIKRPGILVK